MTDQPITTSQLAGPPVSYWWGYLFELQRDTLGFLLRCQAYGDVVKLPIGRIFELLIRRRDVAVYVLTHPSDVKHVLVTNQDNYRKGSVPSFESRIFGKGVLHTEGETHHRQRRLLLPFLHGKHVAAYANLITDKAHDLVGRWQGGMTVDVRQEMTQLTLSVICHLLFGQPTKVEAETIQEAVSATQQLMKVHYQSLLASVLPLWVPTPFHRRFTRGLRSLDTMMFWMIQDRRNSTYSPQNDVLSLLLTAKDEAGRPLSDQEIRDQLVTLMLAGHETTANALTWTWWLLSQFQSVREQLTRELNEVLGDRLPIATDVPRLRYTQMVWNESLRLYPPAWSLHGRISQAEDQLPSGARLPPRAYVAISPWILHRHARWFPDPNRFDPERFSEEATRSRPPYCYLPFGAGGRRCLGESFAELEGLLILATLASRVQLRLVDGQTIQPDPVMTLRPDRPVQMTVQRVGIPQSPCTVT